MQIKINSVFKSYQNNLNVVSEYIEKYKINNKDLKVTKKGIGVKIFSNNRNYHISCHKTKTMYVFNIWDAV